MSVSFRQRLLDGGVLMGTLVQIALPEVAELFAEAGYDWLFIDLEHSPMDTRAALALLTAVDHRIPCVVRVAWNDEALIKKALDIGATGVIVPLVNTAAEARLAVGRCRYPPAGTRSVAITRAHRFGLDEGRYLAQANEDVAVILQVEHADAVHNIEEILAVPGVDGVFVGPFDLSGSIGRPGRIDDPEVQALVRRVTDACARHGVPMGIYAHTPEHARHFIAQGYRFLGLGTDYLLLARMAQLSVMTVRA